MIASYFVSMAVTPVACRYFLGHAEHGRLGKAVEGVHRPPRRRLRADAARSSSRSAGRSSSRPRCSSSPPGWAASRLPSTFFPEIDESMDMIYVRFAPGISVEDAAKKMTAMGKALTTRAARGHGRDGRRQRRDAAERAQPAREPQRGPEHRVPARRVLRPREAQALAGRDRGRGARDPDARVPRRRGAAVPGRPRRERLRERVHRAVRRRGARRQPRRSSTSRRRPSPTSRAPSPASATCESRSRSTTPRSTSTPTARRRASSASSVQRRRADDARRDAREHQHAGRLDRREQRPVVLRRHLLRRRAGRRTRRRSARCPVRVEHDGQARCSSAPTANIRRERRRRRRRAQPPRARRARPHADRGARPRLGRRAISSAALQQRPAHARRRLPLRRPGRADADDVLGPRPRARPRGHGRLHDHGVAVQVAAPAVRHALHDPRVARRDRPRAHGGRAGLLDHRAHGHPDGHRDRRVERHPPRRRREPPLHRRGRREGRRRSSRRRARASFPSR